MPFFSEFKRELLNLKDGLLSRNTKPLPNDYRIDKDIQFDRSKHWVVYDFKNEKIFKRNMDKLNLMNDFQENYFKDERGVDISFDMPSHILKNKTGLMAEIQIPERKYILALLPPVSDSELAEYGLELEDYIWYNVYHSNVQGKIFYYKPKEISEIRYNLVPELHWVWFRRGKDLLCPKILNRAKSWWEQNPEISFHLWTNIPTEDDLVEFLSDISPEMLNTFRSKVNIHLKDDTWGIAKEFCDENFNILKNPSSLSKNLTTSETSKLSLWKYMEDILENDKDKGAMIFKTDILRCMILYLRGGWYSDFNDTYCFTPLKYSAHPTKKNLIYIANDFGDRLNNYILYCPKNNGKWLELLTQILNKSYNVYQVLKIQDETFGKVLRTVLSSFIKSSLLAYEENFENDFTFTGSVASKMGVWINLINTEVDKMLERQGLKLPCDLHMTSNALILFLRYMFHYINPKSILSKRIYYEVNNMASLNMNRKKVYEVKWKSTFKDRENDKEIKDDIIEAIQEIKDVWMDYHFPESEMYSVLLYVNVNKMLTITNMGMYFYDNEENMKYAQVFPYAFFNESFCWISSICHLAQGTSCGSSAHEIDF